MLELLLASSSWPLVVGLALWVGHKHGERYWASKSAAKEVTDQDRLKRLEYEVKQLVQAQNLKGIGR